MELSFVPVWKEAPFVRLVLPLMAGIIVSRYLHLTPIFWVIALAVAAVAIAALGLLPLRVRFFLAPLWGITLQVMLLATGGLTMACNDYRSRGDAVALALRPGSRVQVRVISPPAIRPATYKARCRILSVGDEQFQVSPATDMLVYFPRRDTIPPPMPGSEYVLNVTPARITNNFGNSTFDYAAYCAAKNIFYQVFIRPGQAVRMVRASGPSLTDDCVKWLADVQRWVVATLHTFIPGETEYGLAAALLVGYKDDLDRQLVQAYTNTGVVHVIAISGLHLGLIFTLFSFIGKPFQRGKAGKAVSVIITLAGLWAFSFLVGGGPSVVRAAMMFTTMALGQLGSRRLSVFNNLAASAFFLLCIDPMWLWDIGFQLSYAALVSIVIFMKPIYRLIDCSNPVLDGFWKLNAVTLSAQILTAPICIFYFHQFPLTFLLANIVAVPLSGLIIFAEIAVCAASFSAPLATVIGVATGKLLHFMNAWIEMLGNLSFCSATALNISLMQTVSMYAVIAALMAWLVYRQQRGALAALAGCILFKADRFN